MQNLEKMLLEGVEKNTPENVKNDKVFDYTNKDKFTFTLTKDLVEKLDLKKWFEGYKKEAMVSTAGIRGPQNIIYPHDTRFPINTIGITLATLAKALVLKEKYPDKELVKLAGCEVRYNSKTYLDLIARIQAALGIKTLVPSNRQTVPIWLASFLAFKLDLVGAEYITSSHGISVKNATKDLNNQGSQFLPNESLEFVNKIEEILNIAETKGEYKIEFSASSDSLIDEKSMERLNNGIDLYVEYLRANVANDTILNKIKNFDKKIVIDAVGGAAYNTLSKILNKLGVEKTFDWLNIEEDPFFHSIGKDTKNGAFYDWSLDITVVSKKDGKPYFPVIESLKYDEKLAKYPIGTVCLVTDPDHDRLSVVQIEDASKKDEVIKAGVDVSELGNGRILCIFSANQAFLMIMDFWTKLLKETGEFDKHTRFIVKTTASSKSWDEWAKANGIKVINTPVGFKEIANAIKKIEFQLEKGVQNITVEDIFKNKVELGNSPRMIFGGEESGGMIIGSNDIIKSLNGRSALAMREKSATEAIIIASGLVASLNVPLWKHLENIYDKNNIKARYDVRDDISYYNESEPDIEKLKAAKTAGEALRTKNDVFYLSIAIALDAGLITLNNAKEILSKTFENYGAELDFSNLTAVKFVGDGTYLDFDDKFIEIRPSGTDAKTKAYAGGSDKALLAEWSKALGNYSGDLNETYKKYISEEFVDGAKEKSLKLYDVFANKDIDTREFNIPEYRF